MAAARNRVALPENQRGNPIGKQQQKVSEANSRRALGDIGNVVNVNPRHALEGKQQPPAISRPVTRSFGALLLRNAQAAAEAAKNVQKAVKVDNHGRAAVIGAPKPRAKAVAVEKPTSEVIIEVSPDTVECSAKKRESSRKKKVHTFSSVLTARSKVACGISSRTTPEIIVPDIDAPDAGDQLAVVDYVEDIYKFYKHSENCFRPSDYIESQAEINAKMRAILADWLIEVHHKFELMPETLYLTMHIIDRFLSMEVVLRRELQLVGMTAMLIACKYEEIWSPEVNDFICISDKAYTREQILAMEKGILDKLEWNLTVPTPYVFLVRFVKAAQSDKEMEHMAFFFAELGLMQYSTIRFRPSMLAAASVYAARCTLNRAGTAAAPPPPPPLWTETLKRHTGFSESELRECGELLLEMHSAAGESKLRAVYRKYSSPHRGAVALHAPAGSNFLEGSEEPSAAAV